MKSSEKKAAAQDDLDGILDKEGLGGLITLGLLAREELRRKNRVIFFLCTVLAASFFWHGVQEYKRPEPKLLGETPDGRIRPLPLLSDPIYTQKEILVWAERCVQKLYKLSYVDWRQTIQNDTNCLSDKARQGFANSLKTIGVLQYLTPEAQGQIYAVPTTAVQRKAFLTDRGYQEWIIDVPYRIAVDGRQRGSLEVVMTMRVRRVSLTWREDGLWVEEYQVKPKGAGA